ncbi:MAG: UvrD-helicase domain-containing protein, partial [Chlorobia bacterium]|nr:UvrD-helicase domain-containing protein [Fimbriimonadaceae bacterium]
MDRVPTEEQRQVIESQDARFIVTASAGAGKTYVLVERYLWLIENLGLEPHQILTITFTRKAAAEMKERIVGRLRAMGYSERAQVAETGPIQTIHSFCERLLRENSLAAGIDPEFEIMDEAERARLEDAAIAKAMISTHTERPEAEALLRHLAGQREHGAASPYARLENAIKRVLSGLRGTQVKLEDLRAMAEPDGVLQVLQEKLLSAQPTEVQFAFRQQYEGPLAERLKSAFKLAGKKPPAYVNARYGEEGVDQMASHTAGLIQLAIRAWSELEFEMHRRQCFDYALLEAKAVALLQNSEATRRRISQQYRAVMVDEAQDVNPVQHIMLDSLGIERVMIVGDVQQSIYGFRLADVDQFRQRQVDLPHLRLTKNWRSDEGILSFVDDLFHPMWDKDYERMGETLEFDPDVIELPSYPGVEVWELADKDIGQTVEFLLQMQASSSRTLKDITVLVRFSKFANELHQRLEAIGVKSRIVGGTERFYVRLEIRDLANTLKALADPYDDFALLAALRSPIAGVSVDTIA